MVARTVNNYISVVWGTDIFDQRFGIGAVYLHLILMNREKALETVVVLALASLIGVLWLDIDWLIYCAIGLLTVSLISKKLTGLIGKGWFSFSYYLGVVMNFVIMFIIFYLFLIPLSFFQRLSGSNQILKKKGNDSYFSARNHWFSDKDIKNPW